MAKNKKKEKKKKKKEKQKSIKKQKEDSKKISEITQTPIPFQEHKPSMKHFTPSMLREEQEKKSSVVKTPSFMKKEEPQKSKPSLAPPEKVSEARKPEIMEEFQHFLSEAKSAIRGEEEQVSSEEEDPAPITPEFVPSETEPIEPSSQEEKPDLGEYMDFLSDAKTITKGDEEEMNSSEKKASVPIKAAEIESTPSVEPSNLEDTPPAPQSEIDKNALAAEFGNFLKDAKKRIHGDED